MTEWVTIVIATTTLAIGFILGNAIPLVFLVNRIHARSKARAKSKLARIDKDERRRYDVASRLIRHRQLLNNAHHRATVAYPRVVPSTEMGAMTREHYDVDHK